MNIAYQILNKRPDQQTVFTTAEIGQLCQISSSTKLHAALIYATNQGYLYRISRGIYALNKDYSKKEFANKYRQPSYISLYTVLQEAGIVFQYYTSIFAITNRTQEVEIENQKYIYRKIKNEILLNPAGINHQDTISQAVPERAICDKLYLDGEEFFDNLRSIDWQLMRKLNKQVYHNHKVIKDFIDKNQE